MAAILPRSVRSPITSYGYLKSTYQYQHNVVGERTDRGKMAAMCGRSTPLAGNADETSSLYIYLCSTSSVLSTVTTSSLFLNKWSCFQKTGFRRFSPCRKPFVSEHAQCERLRSPKGLPSCSDMHSLWLPGGLAPPCRVISNGRKS